MNTPERVLEALPSILVEDALSVVYVPSRREHICTLDLNLGSSWVCTVKQAIPDRVGLLDQTVVLEYLQNDLKEEIAANLTVDEGAYAYIVGWRGTRVMYNIPRVPETLVYTPTTTTTAASYRMPSPLFVDKPESSVELASSASVSKRTLLDVLTK